MNFKKRGLERFLVLILMLVVVPVASKEVVSAQVKSQVACDFFPPNNLRFPVRATGQMSEGAFNQIIKVVQDVYAPYFKQAGHPPLKIFGRWTADDVNAFAFICNQPELLGTANYPAECSSMSNGNGTYSPSSIVVLFGGLARTPVMSAEGLVLVACHEIGHHLAGYPRYGQNTEWAASEGQSDYFATAKCARRVFTALGSNARWASVAPVPLDVRTQCVASFQNPEQAGICMRSSLGGLALARVLAMARGTDLRLISFTAHDPTRVTTTFEGHPQAQCRLDTYFAGSICQVSEQEPFSMTNPRQGACTPERVQSRGSRPLCWFAGR